MYIHIRKQYLILFICFSNIIHSFILSFFDFCFRSRNQYLLFDDVLLYMSVSWGSIKSELKNHCCLGNTNQTYLDVNDC